MEKYCKSIDELCTEMDNIISNKKLEHTDLEVGTSDTGQLLFRGLFCYSKTEYDVLNYLTSDFSQKEKLKELMTEYLKKCSQVPSSN